MPGFGSRKRTGKRKVHIWQQKQPIVNGHSSKSPNSNENALSNNFCRFTFRVGSRFLPTIILFVIGSLLLLCPVKADAQNRARHRLFSGAAVARANQAFGGKPSKLSLADGFFAGGLGDGSGMDNFSDAFLRRDGRLNWSSDYGVAVYSSHVRDQVGLPDRSDDEFKAYVAERMFYDQAARGIARAIVGSGLEPLYRDLEKGARWVRDKTTFRLDRVDEKKLKVKRGEQTQQNKTTPLAELKFQLNTNSFVEPRLCIGSNTMLRYDHVNKESLLEYFFSF